MKKVEVEAMGAYPGTDNKINLWIMGEEGEKSPTYRLSLEQASELLKQLTDAVLFQVFLGAGG